LDSEPRTRPPAEVQIDAALVRRLIAAQFPQWAGLAVQPVESAGWDNTIYRLGADLAVRLPRRRIGAGQVENEHRWLPALGRQLPLAVSMPVGKGRPGAGYPWRWTVCPWLDVELAARAPVAGMGQAAVSLARFIAALQAIDATGAGRSASSAALSLAAIESPGRRPRRCETGSMSARRWRRGKRPSRPQPGPVRRYGCTAIFIQRTCWSRAET
jgi:aminoglycoside phosphotransferase (APT) family kinase protein